MAVATSIPSRRHPKPNWLIYRVRLRVFEVPFLDQQQLYASGDSSKCKEIVCLEAKVCPSSFVHEAKGRLDKAQGRISQALESFKRKRRCCWDSCWELALVAVGLEPNNFAALRELGECMFLLGKVKQGSLIHKCTQQDDMAKRLRYIGCLRFDRLKMFPRYLTRLQGRSKTIGKYCMIWVSVTCIWSNTQRQYYLFKRRTSLRDINQLLRS